jgi:hypothetical protein
VRVRRRGRTAVVTWRRAPNAKRYTVVVVSSDGTRTMLQPAGRKLRVTMRGVGRRERVTAGVAGISAGGKRGPVARGRLAAVRRHKRR